MSAECEAFIIFLPVSVTGCQPAYFSDYNSISNSISISISISISVLHKCYISVTSPLHKCYIVTSQYFKLFSTASTPRFAAKVGVVVGAAICRPNHSSAKPQILSSFIIRCSLYSLNTIFLCNLFSFLLVPKKKERALSTASNPRFAAKAGVVVGAAICRPNQLSATCRPNHSSAKPQILSSFIIRCSLYSLNTIFLCNLFSFLLVPKKKERALSTASNPRFAAKAGVVVGAAICRPNQLSPKPTPQLFIIH